MTIQTLVAAALPALITFFLMDYFGPQLKARLGEKQTAETRRLLLRLLALLMAAFFGVSAGGVYEAAGWLDSAGVGELLIASPVLAEIFYRLQPGQTKPQKE
jgi:hypothetical protein